MSSAPENWGLLISPPLLRLLRERRRKTAFGLALPICLLALCGAARSQELPRAAFMGVSASPVTDDLRQKMHLPPGVGVLVSRVIAGASGEEAGLQANDVLSQINDDPL